MIKLNNSNIYIVMYHYVREIKKSKYSNLKGLEFNNFKKQINFFIKNFNKLPFIPLSSSFMVTAKKIK